MNRNHINQREMNNVNLVLECWRSYSLVVAQFLFNMHYLCFFIHEVAMWVKGFLFRGVNWIPSRAATSHTLIYGWLLSLCRSVLGLSRMEALSGFFHHDSQSGAWTNTNRMITQLHLAPAPFIPPMRRLMIFWAVPYMQLAFPRIYCETMEKMQREILRHTQVNITALCKLKPACCNYTSSICNALQGEKTFSPKIDYGSPGCIIKYKSVGFPQQPSTQITCRCSLCRYTTCACLVSVKVGLES